MNTLPTSFKKNGFDFEQLDRVGNIALFAKSKGKAPSTFEVVRIGSHNGFTVMGNVIPPAETYPPSEKWGVDGWSYNDREQAVNKFNALIK